MRRERVIETIKDLPNEFDLETVIERLIFIDKVEKGLKQAEEGKTISHEEVKKRVSKWSE
jgi:predicted transcriptional regulator